MKYYSEKSMAARLLQAEEAIVLGQTNTELSEELAKGGYTDEVFAEGMALVSAVRDLDTLRREQLGSQVVATATFRKTARGIRRSFDTDRRIARQVLAGMDDYINLLRLKERTSRKGEDLLLQVRHFYKKVQENAEVMTLMQTRYNVTVELLNTRLEEVLAVEEALRTQQYLKGQLREMTKQRREAMGEVDSWMKRFNSTARLLFKDDFPKLDKLGIAVKIGSDSTDGEEDEAQQNEIAEPGDTNATSNEAAPGSATASVNATAQARATASSSTIAPDGSTASGNATAPGNTVEPGADEPPSENA